MYLDESSAESLVKWQVDRSRDEPRLVITDSLYRRFRENTLKIKLIRYVTEVNVEQSVYR